ncbi:hypothetical protein BH11ARM2_BH11ARM2_21520 [soil metagenome]
MRADYSEFMKDGVRGKYYEAAMARKGFVLLAPDVREKFPDAQSVNEALRAFGHLPAAK